MTRDRVKTLLAWLEEQGLVRIERLAQVQVAHLTGRGQDVAEGRATVPGIKKPRAED
ncbi:hypothetical protein D3C86_1416660 [compost metagenome]